MLITVYDGLMRISIENNENYKKNTMDNIWIHYSNKNFEVKCAITHNEKKGKTVLKWFNFSLGNNVILFLHEMWPGYAYVRFTVTPWNILPPFITAN